MKKKFFSPSPLLLTFLALGFLLSSCENSSDCAAKEEVTQISVRFLRKTNSAMKDDTASVLIKKIYVAGYPKAVFYTNQYKTGVILSLNPNADSTSFIFEYSYRNKPVVKDTIRVKYRRNYELASVNCNARINFSKVDILAETPSLTSPFSYGTVTDNTLTIYADPNL